MNKVVPSLAAILFILSTAQAQGPNAAGKGETGLLRENLVSFSTSLAEIRKADGHWELWSGGLKIKNLGNRDADAREVLRIIRAFNLNQRGTVGQPVPVMEYWLSNGRAPQKMGKVNSSVFDPDVLQIANCQGQWCLIDESRPWLTFGARAEDARLAMDIIQKYGFTEILYVDPINPVMMVFLAGHDRRPKGGLSIVKTGGNSFKQNSSMNPETKGSAQWFQPPQLHVNPTLSEPVTGKEMVHFDWKQVAVQCKGLDWQLSANGNVLAHFGSLEHEAREASRAMQTLHLTERCQVGNDGSAFTFFLAEGQPARHIFFGAKTIACHANDLSLHQVGSRWAIWEFDHVILSLGTSREEAQKVLEVLQHYKVDHICQIGTAEPPAVTILVRTR